MGVILIIILGIMLVGTGIFCMVSKVPRVFSMQITFKKADFTVTDVKKYNFIIGILWIFLGIAVVICLIPLVILHLDWGILLFLVGVLFCGFLLSWISIKVEQKYRKEI